MLKVKARVKNEYHFKVLIYIDSDSNVKANIQPKVRLSFLFSDRLHNHALHLVDSRSNHAYDS